MIDVEGMAVAILRAGGLDAGVELTEDPPLPFVRVTAAGGPPTRSGVPDRFVNQDVQLDAWGPTRVAALDAANEARSLLLNAPRNSAGDTFDPPAVITSSAMSAPTYEPDTDWTLEGRPCPRYLVIGTIAAHSKE